MLYRVCLVLCGILLMGAAVFAEVPQPINYQGRLIDDSGDPVPDGYYDIAFWLYDDPAATSGHELWTSGQRTIAVTDGLFTYQLGSGKAFPAGIFADGELWLGVKLHGEAEMTPRTQLVIVPYAYHAETADQLSEGDKWLDEEGDTHTGDLYFGTDGESGYLGFGGGGCWFYLQDEGKDMAKINASGIGFINLHNADETLQAILSATSGFGGSLQLYNPNYNRTVRMGSGDGTSDCCNSKRANRIEMIGRLL